ncbi:MAG: HEAT repeat domain-containing protein [Planctomycetota bacterium]
MHEFQNTVALLTVFAVLLFGGAGPAAGAADEAVRAEIAILASPEPPPSPPAPSAISEEDWPARKDEYWVRRRLRARKRLTDQGRKAVAPLLDLTFDNEDWAVRIAALTALNEMPGAALKGKGVGPRAAELLDPGQHTAVRYLAAQLVGKTGHDDAAALKQLHAFTTEDSRVLRMVAADVLGRLSRVQSAKVLLDLLEREDRFAATLREKAEPLTDKERAALDDSKMVRLHVLEALGRLGAVVDVVPALIAKLESKDLNEQEAAARAIGELLKYDINGRPAWGLPHRRKEIIGTFKERWDTISGAERPPAQNKELGLWMSIADDKNLADDIRLNAARQIKRIGVRGNLRMARDLVRVMYHAEQMGLRRALAEAARKFSGIPLEPRVNDAAWTLEVNRFWKALREKMPG